VKRSRTALITIAAAAASLVASPALAAQVTVQDPAGDAANRGLDITRVSVRNLDHSVVVKVRFVESVRGDLIVSIDPRRASGVRLVSEHRPGGETRNAVIAGAFTDRKMPEAANASACRGFRVTWRTDAPVARLRMPSRCLHGGDYGAIRFAVLTERGGDSDYTPETTSGASRWIPRG
jgi:hypothetical protein